MTAWLVGGAEVVVCLRDDVEGHGCVFGRIVIFIDLSVN